MGLSNDPMESIANAVKDSVLPLELNFRKVAKDLETHWRFSRNTVRTNLERVSAVKRKSYDSDGDATGNYGGCVASEGSKNGFLIWLSWKAFFFGVFSSNAGKGDSGNGMFERSSESSILFPNDHPKSVSSSLNTQKANLTGFGRIGSLPFKAVGVTSSINDGTVDGDGDGISAENEDGSGISVDSPKKLLGCSSTTHPNKEKLYSVQDFFKYTEIEGRRFFEELDRDSDGRVTLEDLEIAMANRELPKRYAKELMNRTRSHLFSGSFGWKQFQSIMEHKEPTILQAYMSLCLSKSGTLHKSEILASLKDTGMLSNDENTVAVMRFLTMDAAEPVSYVHFRNFMLLLPSEQFKIDKRSKWSKTESAAPVASCSLLDAQSLLKSALAGGISCAFSAFLMHPVDTVKTQVQASSTLSFLEILSKIPEIGAQGLYKGSIPAVAGQFASHGLRTSIYEASRLALAHIAPTLPDIQAQSVASFIGTFLGTVMRIPCEVLKQRLQANMFDNVVEATVATWHQDGLRGFFRGTGVTLLREVPFYVAGMGLYNESKKAVEQQLGRELEPWETIIVGALSGGFTAVLTTPFDVIKTRMMTAPQGVHVSFWMAAYSILKESPIAFYKGAVPRFFWTAPLGALNLAGYELLRKALDDTP